MLDYLIYFLIIVGFIAFLVLAVGKIHVWVWGHEDEPCYYCGEVNCKQLLTSCKKQHSKHYDNWRGPWGDTW